MQSPIFLSLGGVWLDEIWKDGHMQFEDVLGGSVTFATLGARFFAASRPRRIRLIVIAGRDFSTQIVEVFRSWNVDLSIHWCETVPHARGIVRYGRDESERFYERLTSPLNTDWSNLSIPEILYTKYFHLFEVPAAVTNNVNKILDFRQNAQQHAPVVIWEPQAKSMTPEMLGEHLAAVKLVDVFSPNHIELASFFQDQVNSEGSFNKRLVEQQALYFLHDGIGPTGQGCAVIRCAEHGCLTMSKNTEATWLPAFHSTAEKVVNTTGAGNAFLGGFAIGHDETGCYVQAARYGQIAASFMIEQVGLPSMSKQGMNELWNGVEVRRRLVKYRERPEVARTWS